MTSPTAGVVVPPLLQIQNLSRYFGALCALKELNLQIMPGERHALLGSNGAGKTTLFNCITGDFAPSEGSIIFDGLDISTLPCYRRIRHGLRRTYQISRLFPQLTVREQLFIASLGATGGRFSLRPHRSSQEWESCSLILQQIGLEAHQDKLVAHLAYGQSRQLEIGLALVGRARLILLDEPAAGLSPIERQELGVLLSGLPPSLTIILIEHDLDIALSWAQQVTVMHQGEVLASGSPKDIAAHPEVHATYLGNSKHAKSAVPVTTSAQLPAQTTPMTAGMDTQGSITSILGNSPTDQTPTAPPLLEITGLDAWYGRSYAIQNVSLTLSKGILGIIGRNGMGKTSLCHAITGFIPAKGSVRLADIELSHLPIHERTQHGVAYVPQGRRVWASLSVDEHLRLAAHSARQGKWTIERIYALFPRLAERRRNGGHALSGGEQQMLAIGRALLFNPRVLIMDEPTEGLAPAVVQQLTEILLTLRLEPDLGILLIEQNLSVALDCAEQLGVMVNGRIATWLSPAQLAHDTALQQKWLGLTAPVMA